MNRTSPSIAANEHELAHAYHDLGTAAFALVHNGALSDPRLSSRVRRIYELTGVRPSRTGLPSSRGDVYRCLTLPRVA